MSQKENKENRDTSMDSTHELDLKQKEEEEKHDASSTGENEQLIDTSVTSKDVSLNVLQEFYSSHGYSDFSKTNLERALIDKEIETQK